MYRHEIGALEQLFERRRRRPTTRDLFFGKVRIDGQHFHVEGACELGDPGADVADAHEAKHLAAHFVAHDVFPRVPALGAQQPIVLGNAPRHVEHQADRMLGHRLGVAAGLIDHQDTRLACMRARQSCRSRHRWTTRKEGSGTLQAGRR